MRSTHLAPRRRVATAGLLRAEWIKLRTQRSFVVAGGVLVAWTLLSATLLALVMVAGPDAASAMAPSFVLQCATVGVVAAMPCVVVLAAQAFNGELRGGTLDASLLAVPGRGRFIVAKVSTVSVVTTMLVSAVLGVAILLVVAVLRAGDADARLLDPGVWVGVLGGGIFAGVLAAVATSIAVLVRSTPASLVLGLSLVVLLPAVLRGAWLATGATVLDRVARLLPSEAGRLLLAHPTDVLELSQATTVAGAYASALGILAAWAAITASAAVVASRRRDWPARDD